MSRALPLLGSYGADASQGSEELIKMTSLQFMMRRCFGSSISLIFFDQVIFRPPQPPPDDFFYDEKEPH